MQVHVKESFWKINHSRCAGVRKFRLLERGEVITVGNRGKASFYRGYPSETKFLSWGGREDKEAEGPSAVNFGTG